MLVCDRAQRSSRAFNSSPTSFPSTSLNYEASRRAFICLFFVPINLPDTGKSATSPGDGFSETLLAFFLVISSKSCTQFTAQF